ncbi:MAG: benzoate-CoA ligase family protein [Planctomycetes bacterium]|nr:benzoate-CoA ligase family protein [Planctomycetota bacterium]
MTDFSDELNIADYFLDNRIKEGKGGKTALLHKDQKYTYNDIQRLSNQFANAFTGLGAEIENRIMIVLHDTPEYVGAFFGILKTGAVVVMVNPGLKTQDYIGFLGYTRAKIAVVHSSAMPEFEPAAKQTSTLKNILVVGDSSGKHTSWNSIRNSQNPQFETVKTNRYDPAIWLFSGGTTGKPKAVIQTHQSFANTTECYAKKTIGYKESDITLSIPKLYFGYATGSNLLFPFSVGATTALFDEKVTPDTLLEQIRRFKPTILINVPTMINHLVQHPEASKKDFASLRLTTSAGEALPVELYNKWKAKFGVEILDGIGTAEMWHIFISNRLGDTKPGSLGKIVEGFEAKICDDEGRQLPDNEVGYLWVKGDSRAISYFQRMEETQKAFIGNWYITGDLLRRDSNGYFYYEGRADDMMKVSGKWVSPKDIENCLLKHPDVKECAVVPFTDENGLTKPQAYITLKSGGTGSSELETQIKEFVKQNLEPFKYPRKVIFMENLPRTHLGKVDRKQLKKL